MILLRKQGPHSVSIRGKQKSTLLLSAWRESYLQQLHHHNVYPPWSSAQDVLHNWQEQGDDKCASTSEADWDSLHRDAWYDP